MTLIAPPLPQAKHTGDLLLQRIIKCHYDWQYPFLRPTVEEVTARYKVKHPLGGAHDTAPPAAAPPAMAPPAAAPPATAPPAAAPPAAAPPAVAAA